LRKLTELHALLEQSPSLRPRLPDIYATGPTPEELGEAIDQHRIVAAFQPKIDLDSGAVVGVEAPARWRHTPRGSIPPKWRDRSADPEHPG
jgi:hypothetical protein